MKQKQARKNKQNYKK